MKTTTGTTTQPINNKDLKELLVETKETIAPGMLKRNGNPTQFGIVDLWRMQKKHKTLGSSTRW